MLHLRKRYRLTLAAALLAGCQTVPPTAPPSTLPADQPADKVATTLRAEGQLLAAANEYIRLAATADSPQADAYRLEAVATLIEAKELARAHILLLQPLSPGATSELRQRLELLRASLALAEQRPEAVLSILSDAFVQEASLEQGAEAHRLRIQAYRQLKQYLAAAEEHVKLELVLVAPQAIRANRQDLWQTLSLLDRKTLSEYPRVPPATLDGWIELAALSRYALIDPGQLVTAIDLWRTRYPRHPANEQIVPDLIALSQGETAHPRRLALLLPFEGPFENAAVAIRDGFVAAWFDDASPSRPTLIIRSTASANLPALYREVIDEGADYVIGPLDKPAVASLARLHDLPVPTLALNYVPHRAPKPPSLESGSLPPDPEPGTAPMLYQFALSPEAEAQQVAERAWSDGHRKAAMLFPQGSWGARVSEAFSQAWIERGGQLVTSRVYPNDPQKMSSVVRQLLNIDDSVERYRVLKAALNRKLKHTARRRQDIDFVFLAAFPQDARQLKPLLRFYHAAEVPVYATSHVYSGIADVRADSDIDGVLFADMPWVLVNAGEVAERRRQLQGLWSSALGQYGRLYAFGFDAYRLVPYLKQLDGQPFVEYPGLTGQLVMDNERRIERRLLWARFMNGAPKLDASQTLAGNAP